MGISTTGGSGFFSFGKSYLTVRGSSIFFVTPNTPNTMFIVTWASCRAGDGPADYYVYNENFADDIHNPVLGGAGVLRVGPNASCRVLWSTEGAAAYTWVGLISYNWIGITFG